MQLFWNQSYALNDGRRISGKYGYYNVVRSVTIGDIESNNLGLFVQDSWTINRKLTLNLGLRTESEDVPSYRADNPGVKFNFGDKIAPRVGFAYDVRGDSRLKVYGSWGVFYDLMKLTIGRVMFGGDNWVNYYYTLDSFDWPSISCGDGQPGSGCPGSFITQFDFRPVANNPNHDLVDPDLKAARSQEFTLGMDHELNRDDVGRRALRAQVDRLRDRGGVQLHAERRGRLRRQQPRLRQRARDLSARPQQPGAAAGGARLRRHRGSPAQAAVQPLVG